MSEIICAAIDCEHIDDMNCCRLKEISLSEHFIHTVHEGVQHFWQCKQYEKSEETKRLEEKFIKLLKEQGVLVFNDGSND